MMVASFLLEQAMPKGIPLTEEEQTYRRHEIFHAAAHLFMKQGFQETSMQQIADAAGVGKSTLYDYFPTKDDILVFTVEDEIIEALQHARTITSKNLSAEKKLQQIMQMQMGFLEANKQLLVKLSFESQRLKAESQERIQEKRHEYQDLICSIVEDGIRNGEFRKINPLLAARTLLLLLTSVIYTTRPTGSPEAMLKDAMDIFFGGVLN
ncbi:MAG: TetR/AcrR family transcriptional regulator [Bacteroidota bacterium]